MVVGHAFFGVAVSVHRRSVRAAGRSAERQWCSARAVRLVHGHAPTFSRASRVSFEHRCARPFSSITHWVSSITHWVSSITHWQCPTAHSGDAGILGNLRVDPTSDGGLGGGSPRGCRSACVHARCLVHVTQARSYRQLRRWSLVGRMERWPRATIPSCSHVSRSIRRPPIP